MTDYDVLVVGGGLVGASLARGLEACRQLRVAVIESKQPKQAKQNQDGRAIALAYSSRLIFQSLGLWSELAPYATAVRQIHVSDHGHFGATRIKAEDQNVDALGYVIPAHILQRVLQQSLLASAQLEYMAPAKIMALDYKSNPISTSITLNNETRKLTTKLLVAADGSYSSVRDLLGIRTRVHDYQQSAIVTNVRLSRSHRGIAYERFTATGPVAMMPLSDNRSGSIWSVRNDQVDKLMALDKQQFCHQLQQRFGYRLGRLLSVSERFVYPLKFIQAQQQIKNGIVLLGNSVHCLHPVAGQGFNLGLRDMAALIEVISEAIKNGRNPGDVSVLRSYANWRKSDQRRICTFSHGLVNLFSNDLLPFIIARQAGSFSINNFPWIKKILAKNMMGISNHASKLACGLTLD